MRKRNSAKGEAGFESQEKEKESKTLWSAVARALVQAHKDRPETRNAGLTLLIFALLYTIAIQEAQQELVPSGSALKTYDVVPLDTSAWERCTVSSPPQHETNEIKDIKPILFAQYPVAIPDNLMKSLVGGLTGVDMAAKAFYAQNKVFRQCRGRSRDQPAPTAACLIIHPVVDAGDLSASKWVDNFNTKTVYTMRNPITNIPSFLNNKAIKYGGITGQQPEDSWRESRDKYGLEMLQSWGKSIYAWRNHSRHFENPLYLTYEDIMTPQRALKAVRELADVLRSVGYTNVPSSESDLACIWYQSIGKTELEHYHKTHYDMGYNDYTPGWTRAQQKHIVSFLKDFGAGLYSDAKLSGVLEDFAQVAATETRLDVAAPTNVRRR